MLRERMRRQPAVAWHEYGGCGTQTFMKLVPGFPARDGVEAGVVGQRISALSLLHLLPVGPCGLFGPVVLGGGQPSVGCVVEETPENGPVIGLLVERLLRSPWAQRD